MWKLCFCAVIWFVTEMEIGTHLQAKSNCLLHKKIPINIYVNTIRTFRTHSAKILCQWRTAPPVKTHRCDRIPNVMFIYTIGELFSAFPWLCERDDTAKPRVVYLGVLHWRRRTQDPLCLCWSKMMMMGPSSARRTVCSRLDLPAQFRNTLHYFMGIWQVVFCRNNLSFLKVKFRVTSQLFRLRNV